MLHHSFIIKCFKKNSTLPTSPLSSINAVITFKEHPDTTPKIEQVFSAPKKCEDLTQNDEDEIIHLMTKTKFELPKQQQRWTVSCAKDCFINYDSALQELQNVLESVERRELMHKEQCLNQQEEYQKFSEYLLQQNKARILQHQEPQFEVAKMFCQRKQSLPPDEEIKINTGIDNIDLEQTTNSIYIAAATNEKEDEKEDYIKVPVKDLILTFEHQVEAEKISAEGQLITKQVSKKPRVMNVNEQNQQIHGEYEDLFRQTNSSDTEVQERKTMDVRDNKFPFRNIIGCDEQQLQKQNSKGKPYTK